MIRTSTTVSDRQSNSEETAEIVDWIKRHALLTELCQFGGWPDESRLRIEICSRSPREWIINITFVETIMEISECDVTERERCGQYAVSFEAAGHPVEIRLIQPL